MRRRALTAFVVVSLIAATIATLPFMAFAADQPLTPVSQPATAASASKTSLILNVLPIADSEARKRLWNALRELSPATVLEIPAGKAPSEVVRAKCGSAPADLLKLLVTLNPDVKEQPASEARTLKFIACPYWYFGEAGAQPPAIRVKSGEKLENLLPLFMGSNGPITTASVSRLNPEMISAQGQVKQDGVITLPFISRGLRVPVPNSVEPTQAVAAVLNALPSDTAKLAKKSAALSDSEYHFVDTDVPAEDSQNSCFGPKTDSEWPDDPAAVERALLSVRGRLRALPDPGLVLVADTGVDLTAIDAPTLDLWTNKSVANGVPSRTGFAHDLHGASMATRSGNDIGPTAGYDYSSHGTDVMKVMSELRRRAKNLSGAATFAIAKLNGDKEPYTIGLDSIPSAFAYAREIDADVLTLSVVIGDAVPGLLDGLRSANFVVVVAAGNTGDWLEQQKIFPPALNDFREHMIVVGAEDWKGQMAWFSNRGQLVDLVAPGCALPVSDGNGGFRRVSGTSYSAPLVSYTIGLLKYAGLTVTPSELKNRILASGDFDPDLASFTHYGVRLDMERALRVEFDSILVTDEAGHPHTVYGKLDMPQTWTCDVHGRSHAFNPTQVFKIIPNFPTGGGKTAPMVWERPAVGAIIEVQCDDHFDQPTFAFAAENEQMKQLAWQDIRDIATKSMAGAPSQ